MKAVHDLTDDIAADRELALAEGKAAYTTTADLPKAELSHMIIDLEKQMKKAAQQLEFEKAALLRDQVVELRQIMALKEAGADSDMPAWERMRKLDEAGIAYDPRD
jgi:excinuclease ABC subunit B